MQDKTPRCPHCQNLTVIGTVAGKAVAVCTYCDNGFAVAHSSFDSLITLPSQQVTRAQIDQALEKTLSHVQGIAQSKQDEIVTTEASLNEDPEQRTEEERQTAANLQAQRMMFAGVIQGASSFRDVFGKILGLPNTTLAAKTD
ncbi:hypothetical protein [Pseudoalteromonas umbrosa]|uniref:hypothetical protein n=1 Tax=Pseudoalteromonas umbrosa TaxID=3048489 RepID=UPI0024C324B5|nr:hypothetical protein [Pseudoalteromonas sp. B95]MDK1290110.1 hypothetical protein [Pseudoalteromonas sp. B95]